MALHGLIWCMPLRGVACAGAALVVMAACGNEDSTAAQGFQTSAEDVLTVAAADLPTPGFWEGPADRPSGGFELELAEALAERFDLDEVRVVEVPFSRLVAGDLGGADPPPTSGYRPSLAPRRDDAEPPGSGAPDDAAPS